MSSNTKQKLSKAIIIIISFIFFITTLFILFDNGIFMNLSKTKFNKSQLQYVNSQVKIYDKNNKLMNEEYLSTNQTISLNKVPEHVKQAFISIEDKNFYKHKGLNYKRILKAIITNISTMSFKEGASTISQQLIKNTHLSSKKTISRKIDEILLTQKLERNISKDEI